jgi:hypothetical protein
VGHDHREVRIHYTRTMKCTDDVGTVGGHSGTVCRYGVPQSHDDCVDSMGEWQRGGVSSSAMLVVTGAGE